MEKAIASRATAMMADIVARDNVTALQGILVTLSSLSSSDFLGYFLYNYTTTQTRSLAAGSLLRLPEIPLTQTLDVLSTAGTAIFTGIRLFGHTHWRSLATVSPKKNSSDHSALHLIFTSAFEPPTASTSPFNQCFKISLGSSC